MMLKTKFFTCFSLVAFALSFGQMQEYKYKRSLIGVQDSWHQVSLPDDIFEKLLPNLADIRVYGITIKKDTIEASYVLQLNDDKRVTTQVPFKILNTSHNNKGYYITFEVPSEATINQLQLSFKLFNFDWRIDLEGSHEQKEWFSILEDYRILSIKNAKTFYEFTNLIFPNSNYRFFRLLIKSTIKPELKSANASYNAIKQGVFKDYAIKHWNIKNYKAEKRTDIEVELFQAVPVNHVKVHVNVAYDYYRPTTIQWVSDSIKTQKGYQYNYRTLTKNTLNSIEKTEFMFENTIAKKLKITIENQDNQPLTIEQVSVKGSVYDVMIRFTEPANYYLAFGHSTAFKPSYDVNRFISKIPETISRITLGNEEIIYKEPKATKSPLFENTLWLWAILIVIIVLLGGFTFKMMKSK
ncbi:MAG: DUF3999 family protein [Flavobacteriales bacterium]|nr:DUF3999 family protein [Flavobacteriia bacterium]NCP04810.1 DUF3999 family protein [Flavobacteriales bacterium]PIV94255.1 MAG: DUF3999 domain-containing protein [Flavobacteriaceae bacterium CG17_big_fil_post_rev_8_21_14_2_50_33_15]PIY11926.1 MAG: DUF3999 domain-containing protein [Flavobacteriaceae bacterium CG_4_10_14_3_um_filter_33_47]PJB16254.1 MAG: DUF3999 domain-containing protein [Flavobacteriaceae bacterium CG_4_9_14_3_um_filter_33_16]